MAAPWSLGRRVGAARPVELAQVASPAPDAGARTLGPSAISTARTQFDRPEHAEGAGKCSKPDKRRYFLTAAGSATESAAILDICVRLGLIEQQPHEQGKGLLDRVVAMLFKLASALE